MAGADFTFVETLGGSESLTRGDGSHAQTGARSLSYYVAERAAGAGLLLEGVKGALRLGSRAIFLFPILALVKCAWRGEGSDYITLAFVALVVVFFALLVLFFALFPLAGPRSSRRRHRRLAPPTGVEDAVRRLGIDAPVAGLPVALGGSVDGTPPLRLRGTLQRLDPRGATAGRELLRDAFEGTQRRVVEGAWFVLMSGDVPVIVELRAAPICAGRYAQGKLAFHEGQAVELVATDWRFVDNVETVGVDGRNWNRSASVAAYRGRDSGLHVVARAGAPLVLAAGREQGRGP